MNSIEMAHGLRRLADVGIVNARQDVIFLREAADVMEGMDDRPPRPFKHGAAYEIRNDKGHYFKCPSCMCEFTVLALKKNILKFCPVCGQRRQWPVIVEMGDE